MTYKTTITKKGQITIPKKIREQLNLSESQKVVIEFSTRKNEAIIKPALNFLVVARQIKPKRRVNPMLARTQLETKYDRT